MISPQFPEEVPSRVPERTLREFAGLCLAILGGLFARSWYRHQQAPSLAAWVAAALGVTDRGARPDPAQPHPPGIPGSDGPDQADRSCRGPVLLAVVYYGVMTPLAWPSG